MRAGRGGRKNSPAGTGLRIFLRNTLLLSGHFGRALRRRDNQGLPINDLQGRRQDKTFCRVIHRGRATACQRAIRGRDIINRDRIYNVRHPQRVATRRLTVVLQAHRAKAAPILNVGRVHALRDLRLIVFRANISRGLEIRFVPFKVNRRGVRVNHVRPLYGAIERNL